MTSREINQRRYYDQEQFRVWPDGTVQCRDEGEPHSHMSDDYVLVWAWDDEEARRVAAISKAAPRS